MNIEYDFKKHWVATVKVEVSKRYKKESLIRMASNLNRLFLKEVENVDLRKKKIVPNFRNRWYCKHQNM